MSHVSAISLSGKRQKHQDFFFVGFKASLNLPAYSVIKTPTG